MPLLGRFARLAPSSSSSSSSSPSPPPSTLPPTRSLLCPCSSLSGSDRVVVFLVLVAVVWLCVLVLYVQDSARHSPLQPHSEHLHVLNNARGLELPQWTPSQEEEGNTASEAAAAEAAAADVTPRTHHTASRASTSAASSSRPSGAGKDGAVAVSAPSGEAAWAALPNAAVIVLTYNRPTYLKQALDQLHAVHSTLTPHHATPLHTPHSPHALADGVRV